MNKFKKFYLPLIISIFLFPILCSAQDIYFTLVPRSQDDIGSTIIDITQDSKGYLWIATQNGLYKYDGFQYTAFHNEPTNPNSLNFEMIECVAEDNGGFIWVGHYHGAAGLERYDPVTGIFTHYHHDDKDNFSLGNDSIVAIKQSRDGTLWIGTNGGLDRYDAKTNKFYHYRHNANDPTSISNNQVRTIYEDKEGTIWIGTGNPFVNENVRLEGGLNKLDVKTNNFTRYMHKDNDPTSLIDDRIRAIYEDSYGNFWVGSAGDGLHKMDRTKGTFERMLYDPSHPEKLSRPPVQTTFAYATDHITFFKEDIKGRLWIGTFQGGINVYDPATQKVSHYGTDPNSKEKIQDNNFWTAFKSRDGIIWITTWGSDLYKINPYQVKVPNILSNTVFNTSSFNNNSVFAFAEDKSQYLWLGSNQGLTRKDNSGKEERFLIDKNPASVTNQINDIEADDDDHIWVSTSHGLYNFDPVTKVYTAYRYGKANSFNLVSDTIITTEKSKGNLFWVSTFKGVQLIDLKTGTSKTYQNDTKDTNSISTNIIGVLKEDKNGNLWAGGFNGLNKLDKQTGKFKKYFYKNRIYCLLEDAKGILWVATASGLFSYDSSFDRFMLYQDPSGFLSTTPTVYWLVEDKEQNLWLNTPKGIIKINKEKNEAVLFGKNQGLSPVFLNSRGLARQNGEIVFGNNTGYYSLNNSLLEKNKAQPIVRINHFLLRDMLILPSANGILTSPLEQTDKINLTHSQNTFSFEFSNIDFISIHEDTRLLYMMENYDDNWRIANDNRTAYYFNLPPGKYNFKVKAYSSNGTWSEKAIAVLITPPWWKTWWAYTLYGIILIVLAFATHRYQKQRIVRAERERTQKRELAQAKEIEKAYHELRTTQSQLIQQEKMASLGELTAGIAHEIQNPLNFVNNFSEVNTELLDEMKGELQSGKIDDAIKLADNVKQNNEKIVFHGKRADVIVKGMLQHSRSSSAVKEPTDINKLADEYLRLAYHGLRAKDKSFNATLKTDFDESIGNINIIPQDIGRAVLNLINNAFYAASLPSPENTGINSGGFSHSDKNSNTTVWVSTKKTGDKVLISVRDNGPGIPQKALDKIFQPFFTTKPTGPGTGLGLSLSYDIVKAHGGEIKVKTKEGEGSEFIIHLPVT